jgi:hypothetical protein
MSGCDRDLTDAAGIVRRLTILQQRRSQRNDESFVVRGCRQVSRSDMAGKKDR